MDGLHPEEGELVIRKKYPSAFFGTTLATDLQIMGADTVVVARVRQADALEQARWTRCAMGSGRW